MKVSELIKKLKRMPKDAPVWHVWDDEARTEIECVWETNDGRVLTSDLGEYLIEADFPKGVKLPDDDYDTNVEKIMKLINENQKID